MERAEIEILERFRSRLLARRNALLHRHSRAGARFDLAQAVGAVPGTPIQVCAWCLYARAPGGRWRPVGHLLPFERSEEIETCMCEACARPLSET